jgi:hypothetical protein
MKKEIKPGAWTAYSIRISKDAKSALNEALEGLLGVTYKPLAAASQVVNGINYHFLCDAQVVHPDSPHYAAFIQVYKAPGKKAVISAPVKRIEE